MNGFDTHDNGREFTGAAPLKLKEVESYRGIPLGTHIVEAFYRGEAVEMVPENVQKFFDTAVEAAAGFIQKQEGRVSLILPMMGSIPLGDALMRKLGKRGYDLSKIDLRFAKKVNEGDKAFYMFDNTEVPLNDTRVMIDDIVDTAGAYAEMCELMKKESGDDSLTCFTPGVKLDGENGNPVSTSKQAADLGYSAGPITPDQTEYARINYVLEFRNEWIDDAFGMNSGHADQVIESIHPDDQRLLTYVAEIQTLERYSTVCLAGKPESFAEYGRYLRNLHAAFPNWHGDAFNVMLSIETFHFTNKDLRGRAEAMKKMSMAREYFEGLKSVDYEYMQVREDWRQ